MRIFAEKKKYALSWRKQKVRIFVENFPNKNGYFCLEDRISYDRKRKGGKNGAGMDKETFHSAYETYSTMVYRLCMLYLKK